MLGVPDCWSWMCGQVKAMERREGLADPAVWMAFPAHPLILICPVEFSSFSEPLEMEKLLGLVSFSFKTACKPVAQ